MGRTSKMAMCACVCGRGHWANAVRRRRTSGEGTRGASGGVVGQSPETPPGPAAESPGWHPIGPGSGPRSRMDAFQAEIVACCS
jgi:hypothetical protein